MSVKAGLSSAVHHSMRAYYLAIAAGLVLAVSAFLPWVSVGDLALGGISGIAGLWILGLGILAIVLASLSIVTRKNSRHPLLVVGLTALGIMFVALRWMERSASERAWAVSQAVAIVDDVPSPAQPRTAVGSGVYLGFAAAAVLVLFGLTIVVRRAARPYAEPEDDDV